MSAFPHPERLRHATQAGLPLDGDREGKVGHIDKLPADSLAVAITPETDNAKLVVAVQPFDRIVQPALWVNQLLWRKRIVDVTGPALLLKGRQNGLLLG